MLIPVHMVETIVVSDSEDRRKPTLKELYNKEHPIGELGYKSPACPKYQNYDRFVMTHDLVFLRLESSDSPSNGEPK